MIKSITFDGKDGYITQTIDPPRCPVRGYGTGWYRFSEEEQEKIRVYEEKYKEWEENDKGKYRNPQLVKNLIGRKFEFEGGKINLLFGPNASGKTTIIKALAGKALTTDGFPRLQGPLDISAKIDAKYDKATLDEYVLGLQGNSATIEWDGAPVYYDNFANRRNYGSIGDLSGSVLGDDRNTLYNKQE